MQIDRLISIIAVIVGFAGSLFLLKGVLRLTPDIMAKLSQAYIGYNISMVKNVSYQKADIMSGATLVLIAFSLEAFRLIFIREPFTVFDNFWLGTCIAGALALLIIGVLFAVNVGLAAKYENATKRELVIFYLQKHLADGQVNRNELKSIEQNSKSLLGIERKEQETGVEFIHKIAKLVDIQVPPDIQVEELSD